MNECISISPKAITKLLSLNKTSAKWFWTLVKERCRDTNQVKVSLDKITQAEYRSLRRGIIVLEGLGLVLKTNSSTFIINPAVVLPNKRNIPFVKKLWECSKENLK